MARTAAFDAASAERKKKYKHNIVTEYFEKKSDGNWQKRDFRKTYSEVRRLDPCTAFADRACWNRVEFVGVLHPPWIVAVAVVLDTKTLGVEILGDTGRERY